MTHVPAEAVVGAAIERLRVRGLLAKRPAVPAAIDAVLAEYAVHAVRQPAFLAVLA